MPEEGEEVLRVKGICGFSTIKIYATIIREKRGQQNVWPSRYYEACPESKDTKALHMYNVFNLQKRHCE